MNNNMTTDTSLGGSLDPSFHLNASAGIWRASWAIGLGAVSIVAGAFTLFMLMGRPWRPTLMFIITLVLSDWFKAFWQLVFSSYWLYYKPTMLLQDNAWCQTQGFFYAWAIEMSDFTLTAMLSYVVLGVALRNRSSSLLIRVLANIGYFLWVVLPPILSALGFVNGNRYTNQGTTCYLPVRPFWYRLGLSWIPRYAMLAISSGAVAWLLLYIKAKHRSFMILLKRPESSTSSPHLPGATGRTSTQLTLPKREDVTPGVDFGEAPSPKCQHSPPIPELNTNNLIADFKDQSTPATVESFAEESLNSSSEEMLRRLRRLWVYPTVYFLYWVFPFIYHATAYRVYYVYHPPIWLAGLSSSFVALHCALISAAVWVFERPDVSDASEKGGVTVWRHMLMSMRSAIGGNIFENETSRNQRRSNNFAQQRLAIEMQERQNKARWSAASVGNANGRELSRPDSVT